MKNLKLFIPALISTLAIIGVFMMIQAPTFGEATEDGQTFLPHIRIDPTQTPVPSPTPSCTYTTIDSSNIDIENNVVNAIQDARSNDGQLQLTLLDNITAAARKHSRDMADNNFVGHQGSDSKYGPQRLRDNCYDVASDQEIVWAGNYTDTATLINSWLGNENWKRAMLDDNMKDFGVGYIMVDRSGDDSGGDDGGNGDLPEDYFTVSFAVMHSQPRSNLLRCEIVLENEFGRGVLLTSNPDICNGFYQE